MFLTITLVAKVVMACKYSALSTETDNKRTLKADHLVLNWYKSTGTLQFQGSEAARNKAYLNQLIEGSKDLKDANEPQAKCYHVNDTRKFTTVNWKSVWNSAGSQLP